jgi:hypothetical protein
MESIALITMGISCTDKISHQRHQLGKYGIGDFTVIVGAFLDPASLAEPTLTVIGRPAVNLKSSFLKTVDSRAFLTPGIFLHV